MLPHTWQASRRVVVGYVWWCCDLAYVIACEWWKGCMAWQAPCSRIELSGVLSISVVSSVARTQFGSLCCIPAFKALVPLVDSFLVDAPTGPRSRPRVPRVPRGLRVADVDHAGVLVASDAENHVGLGPRPLLPTYQASIIALPRMIAVLVRALPCPRASQGLRAAPASTRNATWLILPVVICLSQRLSHACVSMN